MAKTVFVAIPHSGHIIPDVMHAVIQSGSGFNVHLRDWGFGCLTHNFNRLWADAYNRRKELSLTHFAMIHSDVGAQPRCLEILLREMDRVQADVLSAVVPIKDGRGLTSTGIRYPGHKSTRRLTMTEVFDLPETFSIHDTDSPDCILAVNVGLFVCRFDSNWIREVCFRVENWMAYDEATDQLYPVFDSEDWLFSEWAHQQGLRVFATRSVATSHLGMVSFSSDHVWGRWETDEEYHAPSPSAGLHRQAGCDGQSGPPASAGGSTRQLGTPSLEPVALRADPSR